MKAIPDPTPGKYRLWQDELVLMNKYDRWKKQAELLKLSKRAKVKLEWFVYYYSKANQKALLSCRHFGISKSVFYKWLAVFDPLNLKALEEGSRVPVKTRTTELSGTEEQNILTLRKQNPEYGKMKIRRLYFTKYKTWVSSWKVQLVIEKYHLQRRPHKLNRQFKTQSVSKGKPVELKKQQTPGFLVAFDSIILYRNDLKRYIVTGIDTVSKVAWARMYKNHSSATAKDLFIRLYAITQGNILNTCQDNGSEFEKDFARLLGSMKIPQYFSRVKTPKDNPVCERFNRTLKEEFLRQGNYTSDIQEFNRRLSLWLIKYNTVRPHQTLKYQTPFEYHFNYLTTNPLGHDVVI